MGRERGREARKGRERGKRMDRQGKGRGENWDGNGSTGKSKTRTVGKGRFVGDWVQLPLHIG